MDNDLFDYTPIVEREPIHWPGGARVAFYLGLNIEHFHVRQPFDEPVGRRPRRSYPTR